MQMQHGVAWPHRATRPRPLGPDTADGSLVSGDTSPPILSWLGRAAGLCRLPVLTLEERESLSKLRLSGGAGPGRGQAWPWGSPPSWPAWGRGHPGNPALGLAEASLSRLWGKAALESKGTCRGGCPERCPGPWLRTWEAKCHPSQVWLPSRHGLPGARGHSPSPPARLCPTSVAAAHLARVSLAGCSIPLPYSCCQRCRPRAGFLLFLSVWMSENPQDNPANSCPPPSLIASSFPPCRGAIRWAPLVSSRPADQAGAQIRAYDGALLGDTGCCGEAPSEPGREGASPDTFCPGGSRGAHGAGVQGRGFWQAGLPHPHSPFPKERALLPPEDPSSKRRHSKVASGPRGGGRLSVRG